jgi:alkanesulfonate monooxygenase SsuD/methylene tetrahydromethanopterin reductase-like flavin-dependent oxidoreductase (luciferase family)
MARLKFGAFLAPHHPIGEHPMLQFRRDLDLVEQLDALGYDEFWCGEHHSSGWETIASGSAPAWSRCPITIPSTSRSAWCSSTT